MMEAKIGSKYERLRKIGVGSYGVVFKCMNRQSCQVVAIKRYSENDSDPPTRRMAMREVRMLRQLRHPNVINLIEVFRRKRRLHLVFDYCELTVLDVIEKYTTKCPLNLIKKIVWQTVNGINYCHTHNCIHRDIKPENILINQSGVVKLCDFGFARNIKSSASPAATNNSVVSPTERFLLAHNSRMLSSSHVHYGNSVRNDRLEENNALSSDREAFTEYVATRWYRAPELLIGDIYYDIKIDIWAIGCVTAELMKGEPIWPGKTDLDQLFSIKSSIGSLTQSQTHTLLSQGIYDQANIERLLDQTTSLKDSLDEKLPAWAGQSGIDFVTACLQMDPARRPTSGELLNHEYIYSARMTEFIQKDHAPTHRLPPIGDRTVTLPSLSPTISRTNSQALMLLTSNKNQKPQQLRPAKRFVAASSENHNLISSTHEPESSLIPLASSKQRNIPHQSRAPMKQVKSNKDSINNTKPEVTDSLSGVADAVGIRDAAGDGKQFKRNQPVKSKYIVNGSTVPKPNVTANSKQQANMNTTLSSGRSLLPVAKIRSRETSTQRTAAAAAAAPPESHHHPALQDNRSTMTNTSVDVKSSKKRDPEKRVVQEEQSQSSATITRRQMRQHANGNSLDTKSNHEERIQGEGGGDQSKENSLGLLKSNNKRKTTANESSASSSNYSDSLGTVRSSSIAFLPPLYQDQRS